MAGGIGFMNYVIGDENVISDIVPVDYCCNGIIACAAYNAYKNNFLVVNCGSSYQNPLKQSKVLSQTINYVKHNPYDNQIFKPHLQPISNEKLLKFKFLVNNELPTKAMMLYAKAFGD